MDSFSGYIFSVLWLIIAIYLIFSAKKISKCLYALSVFFIFLSGWYLANQLLPIDLFAGVYGIIFRCVALSVLIITGAIYLYKKKKSGK